MRPNGNVLTKVDALQVNHPVMMSRARYEVFASELARAPEHHTFTAIEDRHMGVIRAMLASELADKITTAQVLIRRVRLENAVSANVARLHIYEAESLGLIEVKPYQFDRRKNVWSLREGIADKLDELSDLAMMISDTIKAQLADPSNIVAGKELVPAEVYFNILNPANWAAAKRALDAMQDFEKERTERRKEKAK